MIENLDQSIRERLQDATITSGLALGKPTPSVKVDPATGIHYCNSTAAPDCPYTAAKFSSVRAHQSSHTRLPKKGKSKVSAAQDVVTQGRLLLAQLDAALGSLLEQDGGNEELDKWKARAKTAERKLSTLRRALGQE